jgi:subtilisin-like proprotein convertase family protein
VGASDSFTVRLDTATPGIKSSEIIFSTNDPDENPFNFSITGTVTQLPAISVVATDPNASESGPDDGVFTISRSASSAGSLTVNFTVGGSAALGDYNVSVFGATLGSINTSTGEGSITLPAGAAPATIVVSPIDDTVPEGTEFVLLTLNSGIGYDLDPDPAKRSATVNIADNDLALTLSVLPDSFSEAGGNNAATGTVTRNGPTGSPLTVNLSSNDTTEATVPATVTIPAGQPAATSPIAAVDDAIVDGPQTVTFLASASGYSNGTDVANVTDDDTAPPPEVTVSATDPNASESGPDIGVFTVSRGNSTSGNLSVRFSLATVGIPEFMAAYGFDFILTDGNNVPLAVDPATLTGSIVIPDGQPSAMVVVVPLDDNYDEDNESLVLSIEPGTGYTVGTPASGVVTIADDDPQLVVVPLALSVAEGGSNSFTVKLNAQPTSDVVVAITKQSGGDADLNADKASLTFTTTNWNIEQAVMINAAQDLDTTNGSASFGVSSAELNSETVVATEADNDTPVTIASTDVPKAIPDLSMAQSTLVVTGLVGNISDLNVTLNITHFRDWDLDVFLVSPGGTMVELFTDVGGTGDHFVNTTLDDEATRSIVNGLAPFTGSFRPEGSLSTFDGINPNGTWTLKVTDDNRDGKGTLNSWSLTFAVDTVASPMITVVATDPNASESGPDDGVFTISRSASSAGSLTVNFTVGGSAALGDYNVSVFGATLGTIDLSTGEGTITLPAGAAPATIVVSPIDDTVPEGTEFVLLTLNSGIGYDLDPDPAKRSATVNIADNDLALTLSVLPDSFSEAGGNNAATGTVTRNGPTGSPLTVNLSSNDTTEATVPATVTIPAGQPAATSPIAAVDDAIVDGPQTVTFLASASGYSNGTDVANVTDDDTAPPPEVTVSATDPNASESGPDIGVFTVSRGNSTSGNLSVRFSLATVGIPEFMAAYGFDFILTDGNNVPLAVDPATLTGSIVIPDGQPSAMVVVVPLDDNYDEDNESLVLSIEPGTGYTVGTPASGVVTIADDDPQLVVVPLALSVAEGGSNSFTVKLNAQPTSDVVVAITKQSGGDADLNADKASLTFTTTNWNIEQAVMINAAQDLDTTNGSASFGVSSAELNSETVVATEADNDTPVTIASTDVPKAIPDLSMAQSTLVVTGLVGNISDLNVTLNITHFRDWDLDVFLVSPGGTMVELFTDVGGTGDHFVNTTLDDEATRSIVNGLAPFTGSFRPEGSLSTFDGINPNGTWTLKVTDDNRDGKGTLNSWSLTFVMG